LINTDTYFNQQAQNILMSQREDRNTVGHSPSIESPFWVSERVAFWIDVKIGTISASTIVSYNSVLLLCCLLVAYISSL
jgi:hypothetical protein